MSLFNSSSSSEEKYVCTKYVVLAGAHLAIESSRVFDAGTYSTISGQINDPGSRRFSHQMSGDPTADLRSPANTPSVLGTIV